MRHVVLAYAIGVALSAIISAVFLGIVWFSGGLRTEGAYLDWNAVAGVGTALAAAAAIGALAAVGLTLEQVRAAGRTERLSLAPYLRVDLAFLDEPHLHPTLTLPTPEHVFGPEDFGPHMDLSGVESIQPLPGELGFQLCLWITNQQSAALGTAYQVQIGMLLAWSDQHGEPPQPKMAEASIRLAYVEPGKTTVLRIARVRSSVNDLVATVHSVSYFGMHFDRQLRNRHGAISLYYTQGERVQHERSYGLGDEG